MLRPLIFLLVFIFASTSFAKSSADSDRETRASLEYYLNGKMTSQALVIALISDPKRFDDNITVIGNAVADEDAKKLLTDVEKSKLLVFRSDLNLAVFIHNHDVHSVRWHLIVAGGIFGAATAGFGKFRKTLKTVSYSEFPTFRLLLNTARETASGAGYGAIGGLAWGFSTESAFDEDKPFLGENK